MAQADYSIANQGFPATRADINSHLQAIATNNSGTSAPSTQYAGQFWIDTTSSTWTLYIHDGADDIQFATIDTSANTVNFIDSELGDNSVTTAKIADGNVASAKLSYPLTTFSSTGIDDNATSTAITIDSSENVGIGETAPLGKLHVKSADSGATPITSGDELVVEGGSGNIGMSFLSTGGNGQFIYFGDDADNNIGSIKYEHGDNSFQFVTNASEAMRIDSSGNVGIGNTTMSSFNSEANNLVVGTGAGDEGITIYTGSSVGDHGSIFFADGTDVNAQKRGQIRYEHNNEVMSFFTNTSERMRIDVSGNVLFGISSNIDSGDNGISLTTAGIVGLARYGRSGTGTNSHIQFYNANGNVGTITTNGSSTTYGTSSDHRIKENVSYDFDATTRLKQLRPARFNFIADADTTVDGFLAHEVSSVVPEAITGTHNEVEVWKEGEELPEGVSVGDNKLDGEGNTIPVYQGIDQAKLVPLLVKTIQELEARITALETQP